MTEENDRYTHYTNEELRKGAAEFVKELERREKTPEANSAFERTLQKMSDREFILATRAARDD
jgi:hypothetical protein